MKRTPIIFLLLFVSLLLAACSSQKASLQAVVAENDRSIDGSMSKRAVSRIMDEGISENTYEAEAALGGDTAQSTDVFLPAGRKLIRTISLTGETDSFDTLLTGLKERISGMQGYIEQSDISGSSLYDYKKPSPRTASLTIRIPANQTDAFLSSVEQSCNVTNRSENTQDVTLQYSDLESKKKSLEIEQEKIWELLEKAESIDTIITLQQRLSEIRYQLESMESQLKLYDNQVDYSTIYLNIEEVTAFTPTAEEPIGTQIKNSLSKNLALLASGVVCFFVGLITTSPFWIPLALAAGVLIWLLKKRRAKKTKEKPEEKAEKDKDKGAVK